MTKMSKILGLFIYQPQWTLTLKGWLLLILLLLTLLTIFVTQIHSFLAVQVALLPDQRQSLL